MPQVLIVKFPGWVTFHIIIFLNIALFVGWSCTLPSWKLVLPNFTTKDREQCWWSLLCRGASSRIIKCWKQYWQCFKRYSLNFACVKLKYAYSNITIYRRFNRHTLFLNDYRFSCWQTYIWNTRILETKTNQWVAFRSNNTCLAIAQKI